MSSAPAIVFEGVWKKFRRGEHHDSLRDLLPALARRALRRGRGDGLQAREFWALEDVSFEVAPGEALGIIGRNGAGKSTVLKLLTRILKPTRGACIVRGRVGALIELAAGFHPDLTGGENVYLQGAIMGMRRAEIASTFDEIVDFAGIAGFIDTPVKRYSSGMNARLGFSIAAHLEPEVLLIDEVLAVGDIGFQQRCLQRLAEFRERGIAIVFVSHNLQAVASLCDRAMLLRPGLPYILDRVDKVTDAYTTAAAARGDDRATLRSVRLTTAKDGRQVLGTVRPTEMLRLELEVDIHTAFPRCGVELYVGRVDGLRVFDGVSFTDDVAGVDLQPDATLRCSVEFRANVLRGTYHVGINLVDPRRDWPAVQLPGLASFTVDETTRWGGCAELEPRYELAAVEAYALP